MVEKLEKEGDRQEPAPAPHKKMRVSAEEDLLQKYYRIIGVDLTAIPSVNVGTVREMIAEVGPDLSRFRSAGAFASWLILCPKSRITGAR